MPKIITVLTLLLAILLFPPATLALISSNAVPGDAAYPVKRGLENVIYAIASLNPITRAWFSAARSDRRFEEVKILVSSGKSAKDSLQELVTQTDIAVKQIQRVEDPKKKKELIANLQQSIEKYDQGLTQIQKSYEKHKPQPAATPLPRQMTKTPAPDLVTATSPSPSPISSPSPVASLPPEAVDIEETREDLEEIKKELEEEKEILDTGKEILNKEDEKEKEFKKEKSDKDKENREKNDDKKIDKEDSDKDKKDHKNKDGN